MQPDRGTTGAYLKRLLDDRSWNQADLARKSGVPLSSIGRYIAGDSEPTVESARKLAAALDVSVREFVVKVGLFAPEEMDAPIQTSRPLGELTDSELADALEEVARRLRGAAPAKHRPPTPAEIAANPERFKVVTGKRDHREPGRKRS